MREANIFVFGLTDFNLDRLQRIRGAERLRFHRLLDREELVERDHYPIREILDHARQRLDDFPGPIDGIVHYIDFPVSTIVPVLAREYGLPSASLEAVLTCEHKYWSRVEQARLIPEHTPPFAAFDPFDDGALERLEREIGYPFWIKPVKSFSSYLGFRINGPADFRQAIPRIRNEIGRFAAPFDYLLDQVDLPPEVAGIGGGHCIAEGIIGGRQCTLEGFARNGAVHTYGVLDSIREANRSSFGRYQYPSSLPRRVQERMREIAARFMRGIGWDQAPFNIEFFWDRDRDRIWLLEVNTRISESHTDLFEKVDGTSNHEVAVDLALGQQPDFRLGEGEFPMAGKFFLRTEEDARVRRVPDPQTIARLERQFPGTHIQILAEESGRLSDMMDQDSYTFCLAQVFVGGQNQKDLLARYRKIRERLEFDLVPQAA